MDLLSFPDEILQEIFTYCKVQPLMQVCKKFDEVISASPRLMKKLKLFVRIHSKNLTEIVASDKKYQSVCIGNDLPMNRLDHHNEDAVLCILARFIIKSLKVSSLLIETETFLKCLKLVRSLRILEINYLSLSGPINEPSSFVCNTNTSLKHLIFRKSSPEFLSLLKYPSLQKLTYWGVDYQELMKFLGHHEDISFIKIGISDLNEDLLSFLCHEMCNLRKLDIWSLRSNVTSAMRIRSTTVEQLTIDNSGTETPFDINLAGIFNNLKTLDVCHEDNLQAATMVRLQEFLPKLESLAILNCGGDFFNQIQFPKMKKLKLRKSGNYSANEWSLLAQRNPSVENIVIKETTDDEFHEQYDELFRTICTVFTSLKHLEINLDNIRLGQQTFDFIADAAFPKNIKFLQITQPVDPLNSFDVPLNLNVGFQLIINKN